MFTDKRNDVLGVVGINVGLANESFDTVKQARRSFSTAIIDIGTFSNVNIIPSLLSPFCPGLEYDAFMVGGEMCEGPCEREYLLKALEFCAGQSISRMSFPSIPLDSLPTYAKISLDNGKFCDIFKERMKRLENDMQKAIPFDKYAGTDLYEYSSFLLALVERNEFHSLKFEAQYLHGVYLRNNPLLDRFDNGSSFLDVKDQDYLLIMDSIPRDTSYALASLPTEQVQIVTNEVVREAAEERTVGLGIYFTDGSKEFYENSFAASLNLLKSGLRVPVGESWGGAAGTVREARGFLEPNVGNPLVTDTDAQSKLLLASMISEGKYAQALQTLSKIYWIDSWEDQTGNEALFLIRRRELEVKAIELIIREGSSELLRLRDFRDRLYHFWLSTSCVMDFRRKLAGLIENRRAIDWNPYDVLDDFKTALFLDHCFSLRTRLLTDFIELFNEESIRIVSTIGIASLILKNRLGTDFLLDELNLLLIGNDCPFPDLLLTLEYLPVNPYCLENLSEEIESLDRFSNLSSILAHIKRHYNSIYNFKS